MEKFNRIEMVEEPLEDLKKRQLDLMANWATNPNNVISLRQSVQ